MEVLLGLLGIALFFAPFILALVNNSRIGILTRRIEQLELSLLRQTTTIDVLRKSGVVQPAVPAKVQATPVVSSTAELAKSVSVVPPQPTTEPAAKHSITHATQGTFFPGEEERV